MSKKSGRFHFLGDPVNKGAGYIFEGESMPLTGKQQIRAYSDVEAFNALSIGIRRLHRSDYPRIDSVYVPSIVERETSRDT